jgi:hypothetical protein
MNSNTFFSEAKEKSFWQTSPVICFLSDSFPLLFFNQLFSFLKSKNTVDVDRLKSLDANDFQGALQQTFLGERKSYWLGNDLEKLPAKKREKLNSAIKKYSGPHTIILFLSKSDSLATFCKKSACVIELEQDINYSFFTMFTKFFEIESQKTKVALIKSFFNRNESVSLDEFCLFMRYLEVASASTMKEFLNNSGMINEASASFYSLSQLFFEKQEKQFFLLWSKLSQNFPDTFWASYWIDQLWRAYHVTLLSRQNKHVEAKRISFKLPFSYLKTTWRTSSLQELSNSCDSVYQIDYALKRGSTFCSLDLFFNNYFKGRFKGG